VLRGTGLGTLLGLLPGGGATLASFSAYSLEKKVSKRPQDFGTGVVEGVAAPEAANNAAAQSSFIPLLTLGIPSNNMMAMMLSAFMIHGITPGPTVLTTQPEIFWGLVASMWIGNLLLVVINLPLIGLWVKLLSVPYRLLYPAILLFCCIGVYSMNNRIFDVILAAGFGLVGYLFRKAKCEPGPLLLGFVLGPLLEANLRRTLLITQGDPSIFVQRPISLVMLIATVVLLGLMILPSFRKTREQAFSEEEA
jgi:putative tricarboxylic transport membrane protein